MAINSFDEDDYCGGKINRISSKIIHLQRGNIYEIEGKTFFVMGGCKSSAKWKEKGLYYDGEEPSNRELCLAYENLKKYENKVDYILTHKYVNYSNSDEYSRMSLEGLTKYLDECVTFKHWYSGHWHGTKYLDDKHTVVYDEPIAIL